MLELTVEQISMGQVAVDKSAALHLLADKLVADGLVAEGYLQGLQAREAQGSTFLGQGIAIPHGTESAKNDVLESGISVIQVPEGVDFNGEKARVVFGIAGKDNTHLEILSNIAIFCSDMDNVEKIVAAKNEEEIMTLLGGI